MPLERLTISVPHEPKALSAILEAPDGSGRGSAVLLAHGAGFGMESPWMARLAAGLVARGFRVLRFNYPYRQRAGHAGAERPPDRREVLEEAHERALETLAARADGRRLLLAGKSLGGRIATHLAAKGSTCAGLVLYGYPLHAPGRPGEPRREHFPAIAQPALFLQGTRDDLCDLELLREALRSYGGRATLSIVDGADHSFRLPKRAGKSDEAMIEELCDRTAAWEAETFPD
jgi:predicted alpha/beta-hydrolase family hydrolase